MINIIKGIKMVMIKKNTMGYTTVSAATEQLINRVFGNIKNTTQKDPYSGLIIASHEFKEPYPPIGGIEFVCTAILDLLIMYVMPYISGYCKFTFSFTMKQSYGEDITFTTGDAIPLTTDDEELVKMSEIRDRINVRLIYYAEKYQGEVISRVTVRAYMSGKKKASEVSVSLSYSDRSRILSSIILSNVSEISAVTARKIKNKNKKSYSSSIYITRLQQSCKELKPFIVADIETLMESNIHKPYAAGLMVVRPNEDLNPESCMIETYYSEDYSFLKKNFEERSTKMLYDFVCRISAIVEQERGLMTIFFHNFSRFDGIILLKHLACHHKNLKLKPLMRNNRLYELAIYSGKKMLFRFRDSLNLLPNKLEVLAKNLCPVLGPKGSIDYDQVNESTLVRMKDSYLTYLKQDILILGGVMKKAQSLYWSLYSVDIESIITISSLALTIFRMKYYDDNKFPIYIPNHNEDTFIRHGYYGGHVDAYKPYGKNLYMYDVNSLYPFVMKEYQMPGGVPVWDGNLSNKKLDDLFGFIEAYVVCPKTLDKPFLPYRDKKSHTLIFPTGEFVGVYFTEELKYAKSIGYTVYPISGYLFERLETPTPFKNFVHSLYESRVEARNADNDALSFVYKIIMNSLYGRFGINPKSTMTEICDKEKYDHLMRHREFISGDMLSEDNYIVSYHSNTDPDLWKAPKNAAIQIAAAITAYARIYMHPFIMKYNCYYTDTDAVACEFPLPEEMISPTELGKFKLVDKIVEGYFLAPKAYCYTDVDGEQVLKYKGPAKSMITPEWYELQYENPSRTSIVQTANKFLIDRESLQIKWKTLSIRTGIALGTKRDCVYTGAGDGNWTDTVPKEINDMSCLNNTGKEIINSLNREITHLKSEIETHNLKQIRMTEDKEDENQTTEVTNPDITTSQMLPPLTKTEIDPKQKIIDLDKDIKFIDEDLKYKDDPPD